MLFPLIVFPIIHLALRAFSSYVRVHFIYVHDCFISLMLCIWRAKKLVDVDRV